MVHFPAFQVHLYTVEIRHYNNRNGWRYSVLSCWPCWTIRINHCAELYDTCFVVTQCVVHHCLWPILLLNIKSQRMRILLMCSLSKMMTMSHCLLRKPDKEKRMILLQLRDRSLAAGVTALPCHLAAEVRVSHTGFDLSVLQIAKKVKKRRTTASMQVCATLTSAQPVDVMRSYFVLWSMTTLYYIEMVEIAKHS